MPYCPQLQSPPPKNWQDFEQLCWGIWKSIWVDPNTQKNGRSGQQQHGVDIYGQPGRENRWAGVQCKGKENFTNQKLTETELITEVDKAKIFIPSLSQFIIATTAPRDAKIQEVARKITDLHKDVGLFIVSVFAWDDIEELMLEHKPEIARSWYPWIFDDPSYARILAPIRVEIYEKFSRPKSSKILSIGIAEKPREQDADNSERGIPLILGDRTDLELVDSRLAKVSDIQSLSAKLDNFMLLLAGQENVGTTSTDTKFAHALSKATSREGENDLNMRGALNSGESFILEGSICSEPVPPGSQQDETRRESAKRISLALRTESGTSQGVPPSSSREHADSAKETFASDALTLLGRIHQELSLWNYNTALYLSGNLEQVLTEGRISEKAIRSKMLFLLARVHIACAETNSTEANTHTERAKSFLAQIDAMSAGSVDAELAADIEALKGSIENLENGPDAALVLLAGRTDAYAIRIRLAMLLKKQDLDRAVALIENLPPNDRWCDLAIVALALKCRHEEAVKLLQWAAIQQDRIEYSQCVVRLADALFVRSLSRHAKNGAIRPHDLSEEERDNIRAVLETLKPVLDPIVAAGQVDSHLGVSAVKIAWQVNHLLGNRKGVAEMTRLMYTHRPVPVEVARSVVSGYIELPPDLTDRLREDHPSDFNANILAAVVQSSCMREHEDAFAKAKELIPLADTDEKKDELFKLFQQIWQELEGEAAFECERIAISVSSHNPKLHAVFEAARALRAKDPDTAIQALDREKADDDLHWLQLRANSLIQKGQLGDAVDFLLIAAKRTREPTLLHKTADLAFQAEKIDIAAWCYERLLEIEPDNLAARTNLASIYTSQIQDMGKAEVQLRALHEAAPENPHHTVNLAIWLAQLYRPQESLALYDEVCDVNRPDIRGVLGRAELHLSLGDPDAALSSLKDFRQMFWNSPNFLLMFMNTAYAAGDDDAASEALKALNMLREAGGVEPNAFQRVPADEGLEMLKKGIKDARARTEHLHSEMLKGRMPWVWAEQVSGNAIYWGWRKRTHETTWVGDDPVNRANFCIYATNGFHVRKSEKDRSELLPLECPPEGTQVVADISSLITLHRLGLLDLAAEYFGDILVPEGYLRTVLDDSQKMVFHQLSLQRNDTQIAKKAESGKITVLRGQASLNTPMIIVDEHGESEQHCYRLIDLIRPAHKAGVISDAEYERISKIFGKKSGVDEAHSELAQVQEIQIHITTLEALTHFNLLDAITGYYKVHITEEARTEIRKRIEIFQLMKQTREWHFDLWKRLRHDPRFHFVPHTVPEGVKRKDATSKDYLPFLASFVAQQTGAPLFADDRVCQVLNLNEDPEGAYVAFGTDALTCALMTSGRLDSRKAAESIQQLMKYRYRFVLPCATVLKALAEDYSTNPPGQPLQEIAEYVHDCMRDPGLFGGSEKTENGESMAMRLYLSWVSTISKFLISVWDDLLFSDDAARRITEWSVQEFIPSPPGVLHGSIKVSVSSLTPRVLLSHVLINSNTLPKGERIPNAMKALKDALLLSDDEYLCIVTGILNDTRRTEPHS